MITVRIEYGGMRVENDVPAGQEQATLARMMRFHRLVAYLCDPMRGRQVDTGSKFRARFITQEAGA